MKKLLLTKPPQNGRSNSIKSI